MENQPTGDNQEQPPKANSPTQFDFPNMFKATNGQDIGTQKLEKRIDDKADRWMIRLTAAIVIAALVQAAIFYAQWNVMNGQLQEMKDGGKDTHELVVQAGKQANSAKAQSEQAMSQTDKMTESLTKTDNLIRATNRLARASEGAVSLGRSNLALAKETLQVQQRPWVSIAPVMETGLFRNVNGLNLRIRIKSRNTGTTPAIHSFVYAKFFPMVIDPVQTEKVKMSICDDAVKMSNISENVITPGDFSEEFVNLRISPAFLNQYTQHGFLLVQIAFCAVYSGNLKDTPEYRSPQVFDLYRSNPEGGRLAIDPTKDTPLNDLRITSRTNDVTFVD